MLDDSGGEEDEEGKGRAEDEVVEAGNGRASCGFQSGVETGSGWLGSVLR